MNNPFNDKINKAVAEAARKVMEQTVAEGSTGISVRKWAAQVRKDHGPDIKVWNRQEGGGAVDSVIAKNSQGEIVGVYNRKTGHPTVFAPRPQGVAEGFKEEVEQMSEEYVIHKGKHEPGRVSSLGGQTLHGVTVKHVYTDKKEAQAHADAINKGRGYKPGDEKNSLYGGVLYQVSPAKSMNEEAEQIAEKAKWRSSSAAKPDPDHDWDRSPRSTGGMRATSDTRGDTGGEYSHSSLENRKKAQVVAKTGKTTKASNTSLKGRILGNLANKQSKPNLPEEFEQMDEELQVGQKVHVSGITGKHTGVIKKIRSASDGNQYFVKHDDSAILKSYPRHKISVKEEVEQIDEAPYMGKGNHKPGWMLRADPKLAKAFKDAEERIKERRARQAKWAGVSIPSKSDKMEEEAEHMDESRRWNPDGSPKNVGLKAAKKFGKEQDQKTALHHFAKGAAKDDLSRFKKEETSHIAERLIGKQHKIDANKNGKIDAHDFKLLRKKSKMMKESYLVEDTTPALSAAMKAILADAFHMYFKAHTFHWNVEGANFPEYHKFFGDVYEQLFDTIDPIAEEIRALGEYAPRSLTELKGSTSIDDSSVQTPAEMFGSLLADNSKIIAGLTNGYKVAEAAGEIGLSNFLQDKIDAHKKLGWMIKSVSKGA
jgi:starvation-inducible DNA-binding protein